jgi:hypothetical protein
VGQGGDSMANDPTTQAVAHGVVSALGAAGLLRPQAPVPPAPPPPAYGVGDGVVLDYFEGITKMVRATVTYYILTFAAQAPLGGPTRPPGTPGDTYELGFPPNSASFLPDLDRLLIALCTAPNASNTHFRVQAQMQITNVVQTGTAGERTYEAELNGFSLGLLGGV